MTIRWGFLGAGYVASRAMAPAVHASRRAMLQGVASRERSRSSALEPVEVFDSYEDLIQSSDIDAVYISLTNSQHRVWTIEALRAGKHVLCEKPLAMNALEVESMRAAADESGRSLVEAVWVRWHPRHRRFAELVRSGALGSEAHLETAFTFASEMKDNYRLRPELGGGALLDVGCYQIHTWLAAFGSGAEVSVVNVDRLVGSTGVDLTTTADVRINGTNTATMVCSFVQDARQILTATGPDLQIAADRGEAFTSWREASSLRVGETSENFPECDAFVMMVEQVSRQFSGEEPALFDFEDSLQTARILDRLAE